jgi:hypothetical protein
MIYIFINITLFPLWSIILLNLISPASINEFNFYSFLIILIFNIIILNYFHIFLKIKIIKFNSELILPFGIFIISTIFYLFKISQEPFGMWDSWAMWNAKAKDFTLDFLEGNSYKLYKASWPHPGYPTYIPLQISFVSINLRIFTEFVSYIINYFYLIFFGYMMIRDYSIYKEFNLYKITTFFPFLLLSLIKQASDLCADFPLSIFFCFILYLLLYKEDLVIELGVNYYFIIGTFIGILPLIKNEGIFFMFFILITFIVLEKSNFNFKNSLSLLIGLFIPIIFFVYYKMNAPEVSPVVINLEHLFKVIIDPIRYKNLLLAFLLFNTIYLYLFIPFVIYYFIKYKFKFTYYIIPIILIHITFNLIFLITPEDQIWHINTAYYRLNMQLVPAFFLITQFMIKKNIQNISLFPPKNPQFSN